MITRNCPQCGNTIVYKTEMCRLNAGKAEAKCYSCAGKLRGDVGGRGNGLTAEQIEILRTLHFKGRLDKEIAAELGITTSTVGRYVRKFGRVTFHRGHIERMSETEARCGDCGAVKNIEHEFPKPYNNYGYVCQPTVCSECKNKKVMKRHSGLKAYFGKRQSGVKTNAQVRNLEYALPDGFLLNQFEKQKGMCFYTEVELQYVQGKGIKDDTVSVDRVDNSIGYVPGNVVLCSYKSNSVKRSLSLMELKTLIPSWYHRLVMERLVDDETGRLCELG